MKRIKQPANSRTFTWKASKCQADQSGGEFDIRQGAFTTLSERKRDFMLRQPESGKLIGIVPSKADSLLLFPTADADKDPMKVKITLKGAKDTFNDFANQDGYVIDADGATMTVTCPVYDSYKTGTDGGPVPLRFMPNYRYVLQFMIMGNDVRIVTVVPRVYEWLDGETDLNDENGGYEEQDLGQPVTFGGVVWNDRNLGANSAHPLSSIDEWRKSVGYFYQFNRNIPYFPNTYRNKNIDLNTPLEEAFQESPSADDNFLGNRTLYPVVNYKSWDFSYFRPGGWYPPEYEQAVAPKSGSHILALFIQ